jgi:hypothetical protein
MTKLTIIDENDKQLTISEVEKNNKNHLLFEIGTKFVVLDEKDVLGLYYYLQTYFENQDE